MALRDIYLANLSLGMSNRKISNVQFRVTTAHGQEYINALTQTLKDGTALGLMLLSFEDLSAGNLIKKGVALETEDDAADYPAPDQFVFPYDKFGVSFQAGFDNYQLTIPGRDDTKVTVASDGVTVLLTDGATTEVENFVSRFNGMVLGKNGTQGTVTNIKIVS